MIGTLIRMIAPPDCIACQKPGEYLCVGCAQTSLVAKVPSCFYCNALTIDGRACKTCQRKSKLRGVHVLWRMDGAAKDLVYTLKFGNDRGVAQFVALRLVNQFNLADYDIITFIPSDGPTLRRRGYNQADLLARAVARRLGKHRTPTLLRTRHTRQVGQSRTKRFESVVDNFICNNAKGVMGKRVLLVDDVLTTGATMSECARILRAAGAKQVWGLAVAKK